MLRPSPFCNLAAAAFFTLMGYVSLAHGQTSQPSGDPCFVDCASNQSSSTGSGADLRALMRTLAKAYQNSIMQDAPDADLEADDLLLENSSIVFSLRMLDELGKGVCQSSDPATPTIVERSCPLDEELAGLNNLSNSLSYAASRLERISDAASRTDLSTPEESVFAARIRSMEHLYRLVFALSHIYLDSSQSEVYLQAAGEQLQLANNSMEKEREVCSCDSRGFALRFLELSQLGDRIASLEPTSLPQ